MTYGTLVYRLDENETLIFPVVKVELRGRRVIVTGRIDVYPGQPDVRLPAGDWPCTLLGVDGLAIWSSSAHIEADYFVHCGSEMHEPASLHIIQPFGDPAMQGIKP